MSSIRIQSYAALLIRPFGVASGLTKKSSHFRTFSARVVLNHSTHCDSLIAALEKLSSIDGIRSIVPGRLATARCNSERLSVRVTVRLRNGYKMIARKGTHVQEVFVVTRLSSEVLQQEINRILMM